MKIDYKKTLQAYQAKHNQFEIIRVPNMRYMMIDGKGDPENQQFSDAAATLYPVAYALKFASKANGKDYVVPPLEGLWWADNMSAFTKGRKNDWMWTLMLMVPDWITNASYEAAIARVASKNLPAISKLRIQEFKEGTSVQFLHIGSYSDQGPALKKLHNDFIPSNRFKMSGKHHEIYISNPQRSAADKLKTIIRQPVQKLD